MIGPKNSGRSVPWDCFARIKRVLAHQNIGAFRNDMYVADFIGLRLCLAHLSPFGLLRLEAGVLNDIS